MWGKQEKRSSVGIWATLSRAKLWWQDHWTTEHPQNMRSCMFLLCSGYQMLFMEGHLVNEWQTCQSDNADSVHCLKPSSDDHTLIMQWTCDHQSWTMEPKITWSDKLLFFSSSGQPGVCVTYLLSKDVTRIYYGQKVSHWRMYEALGNVLVRNLGSCHSCGRDFDMYRLHCYKYTPSWQHYSLMPDNE